MVYGDSGNISCTLSRPHISRAGTVALITFRSPLLPMPNLTHFMIPADDVARAKRFYAALLGWKIEQTAHPENMDIGAMQYHEITTGPVEPGALNSGGLYKRHQKEPILSFVKVEDIEGVVSKVEMLGGKVTLPVTEIPGVGMTAMILDTEGNQIGIWTPID